MALNEQPHPLLIEVEAFLNAWVKPGQRVCVGLSGGVDSTVLLYLLHALSSKWRFTLSAIHVNHQLSPHASQWATWNERLCGPLGIALQVVKVKVQAGNSLESAAREARYAVYQECETDFIALAHNQDDQVETFGLRLLRGAGVRGLAAMSAVRAHQSVTILRPLLRVSRQRIERYARDFSIEWVEDESNTNTHYLRNFLRQAVLPLVAKRVPGYRQTIERAASHLSDASQFMDEVAEEDMAGALKGGALCVATLERLSRVRATNLLRFYLSSCDLPALDQSALDELLRQLLTAKEGAQLKVVLARHVLYRFRGALYVVVRSERQATDWQLDWQAETTLTVPALQGVLTMRASVGEGIDWQRLTGERVLIGGRRIGGGLRPDGARPRRALKQLFQELAIAPWLRERLPFLYCGDQLVWVPGLGIELAFQARPNEPSVVPQWQGQAVQVMPRQPRLHP